MCERCRQFIVPVEMRQAFVEGIHDLAAIHGVPSRVVEEAVRDFYIFGSVYHLPSPLKNIALPVAARGDN